MKTKPKWKKPFPNNMGNVLSRIENGKQIPLKYKDDMTGVNVIINNGQPSLYDALTHCPSIATIERAMLEMQHDDDIHMYVIGQKVNILKSPNSFCAGEATLLGTKEGGYVVEINIGSVEEPKMLTTWAERIEAV